VQSEQLPLFVYGTLRRNQENYILLRGHTLAEVPATITGMTLYSLLAYPVMIEGNEGDPAQVEISIVHGELMTIHPRVYSRLLDDLDQLEGYRAGEDTFYKRVVRCVRTASGTEINAWMYLGEKRFLEHVRHTHIPHGDWCRFRHDLIHGLRFGRFGLNGTGDRRGEDKG
jgi:gamma-glutamylcyclotransferase (GGCT)/AIG2-like uncharacterized protein YtfP